MTTPSKRISIDDVKTIAIEQMKKNTQTTTLDVKKALRDLGFHAKQRTISDFMNELMQLEGWEFTTNGIHRIYTMNTDPATNSPTNITTTASPSPTPMRQLLTKLQGPPEVIRPKGGWNANPKMGNPSPNDWFAYDPEFTIQLIFPSTITRDAARYAAAKLCGKKKNDMRACRHCNK